ncbi:MAG: hypothetical protein ACK5W7_02915 [Gemmatimonadaceae bacterium]
MSAAPDPLPKPVEAIDREPMLHADAPDADPLPLPKPVIDRLVTPDAMT